MEQSRSGLPTGSLNSRGPPINPFLSEGGAEMTYESGSQQPCSRRSAGPERGSIMRGSSDIISECPGDFVGIRNSGPNPRKTAYPAGASAYAIAVGKPTALPSRLCGWASSV